MCTYSKSKCTTIIIIIICRYLHCSGYIHINDVKQRRHIDKRNAGNRPSKDFDSYLDTME